MKLILLPQNYIKVSIENPTFGSAPEPQKCFVQEPVYDRLYPSLEILEFELIEHFNI